MCCGLAQTYPVGIVTTVKGAGSLFLDEFANPVSPVLSVSMYLRDFASLTNDCKLQLTITGPNGVRLKTHFRNGQPDPLSLFAGQTYLAEGTSLSWYFDIRHLDISNLDPIQFEKSKRLPEGHYSFSFEVLDYRTELALSLPAQNNLFLSLADPPIVISPVCAGVIENTNSQGIVFQWQLANPNALPNFLQLHYRIDLYEVNNQWSNPLTAIINNQALKIWQSDELNAGQFFYGLAEPPMQRGKRYVFTIKALSADGRQRFKNMGVSAPCYFHFGYYEGDTIAIVKPEQNFQFTLSTPSEFKWRKPAHALPQQLVTYKLRLCEVLSGQTPTQALQNNTPFYLQEYLPVVDAAVIKTIPPAFWMNVQRMGHYVWQVTAHSGLQDVASSPVMEFTGPPAIENFIAGGFLMSITRLQSFDTTSKIASGRCKTLLNPSYGTSSEFEFKDIQLSALGNNEWVLSSGGIASPVVAGTYTLQEQDSTGNGTADFIPDSVLVNVNGLRLSGLINWTIPLLSADAMPARICSDRTRLSLSNASFLLNSAYTARLKTDTKVRLADPFGFGITIAKSSECWVNQNRYMLNLNGFVQLPAMVQTRSGNVCQIAFSQANNLFYIVTEQQPNTQYIQLQSKTGIELVPQDYVIDFSDAKSPAEFPSPFWKGLYCSKAALLFTNHPDAGKQLQFKVPGEISFTNTAMDANISHVTSEGLFLRTGISIPSSDTLRFNSFLATNNRFGISCRASQLDTAALLGGILIPFIDTLQTFPFRLDVTPYGFSQGYLTNGLAGHQFTFNAIGGSEQKIYFQIKRALFQANQCLELDADIDWPHFDLQLKNVQGITVWGNGNLGITVPNGKSPVTYQCRGKAGENAITVDYFGCGRNGNAYAIGASAKIVFDDEFSGDNGPPVINAYSICKNPLLSGSVTSVSTNSNTVTSAAAIYTAALSGNLATAYSAMAIEPADTASGTLSLQQQNQIPRPVLNANTLIQLKEVIALMYWLKPYIKSKSITEKDWRSLDRLAQALEHDLVKQAQLMNARDLLNYLLNKTIESLVADAGNSIQQLSDRSMQKLRQGIYDLTAAPINHKIDKSFTQVQAKLEQRIVALLDDEQQPQVKLALSTVFNGLSNGIKQSVSVSVEENLISPLTDFVQTAVTSKIKTFIETELRQITTKVIETKSFSGINLRTLASSGGTLLVSVADTIKTVVLKINGNTFVRTADALVEDAITKIDWNTIATQITAQLLKQGLTAAASAQVGQLFGQAAGPYAQALLDNVKFDFDNLGSKLKNGEFDKVVKFDPTNIYMVTPAADIRGSLVFTKNDSLFGDCWKANVLVRLKAPKKDNPIECAATFLTGKTTGANGFNYWYAKLGVKGFSVPLTPAPVIWDGVEGFVYSRMNKTSSVTIVPSANTKFGLGCKFYFYDQPGAGKTYLFDLGAEAQFDMGGFALQLNGNASVLNKQQQGKYVSPGLVTGTGNLGYFKTPECSKLAGNFSVKLNTEPILCAGAEMGLDIKSPQDWKVWLGTPQQPFGVKVLCKDFLSNTSYLEASNKGFSAAFNMNVNLSAKTPWIETSALKFRVFANLQAGYAFKTALVWEPSFQIQEASFAAWLNAAIGADYQVSGNTSSITVAGVAMSGDLAYKSQPEAELHGSLAGSITLLGYNLKFDAPVHYSLSKQQIIE